MASQNCLNQIAIGPNQPSVLAWSSWREGDGCGGAKATYPTNYDINLCSSDRDGIGANDIDTIWVPPNVEVSVDYHCEIQQNPVRFDGTGTLGQGVNYPGLYQMDDDQGQKFIADKYGNGNRISLNDIDVVHTRITKPWDQHLYECCKGDITDDRLCGRYRSANRECQDYLSRCSVNDLKNNSGCQELCKRNPLVCDRMKFEYCSSNPNDSWCSCMNVERDPDYQKFAKKVMDKTGQGPRIGCSSFGRCNTGLDYVNIFLPSNVASDKNTPCPSYSTYLDQSVTTIGDNNVVTPTLEANINQPPSQPVPTPEVIPTPDQLIQGLDNKYLLFIFIIFAIIVGYYLTDDSSPQYMLQPYQQPYQQPYSV